MRLGSNNQEGVVLVVGLMLLGTLALVAAGVVTLTSSETRISGLYREGARAFQVAEAGIQEAIYRLSLLNDPTVAPPLGSRIEINGLADHNAHIDFDPNGLLQNDVDDDGNGLIDDPSDLNYHGAYDNRLWSTHIMLNTSEAGYTDTATTIYTVTIQPAEGWLRYSSSQPDGTELTICFKQDESDMDGDGDRAEIVFYDPSRSPSIHVETPSAHASGLPVLVISSTGRDGTALRRVVAEVVPPPVVLSPPASLTVDFIPSIQGSALISGFNHCPATSPEEAPSNPSQWIPSAAFNTNGVDNHGGHESFSYPGGSFNDVDTDPWLLEGTSPPPANEEELASESSLPYGNRILTEGHRPGICIAEAGLAPLGSAEIFGGDDTVPWLVEGCPTYANLAEALGLTQAQLEELLQGAQITMEQVDSSGKLTVPPCGLMYIDNAGGPTFKITSSTPGADQGWGLLVVTGDADLNNFAFKGFIYVGGDAKIAGNFWLLGSMVVKGQTTGDFTMSNGHMLFSREVLKTIVPRALGFRVLTWKETVSG